MAAVLVLDETIDGMTEAPVSHLPGLLTRGFGVRVPGGAPVLTWGYIRPRSFCLGRFRPVVAPWLLVSLDLVARNPRGPCLSADWSIPLR
jgi:hypothetical protein